MKKLCGTCAYWDYMGYDNKYEDDEGKCTKFCSVTKQDEICEEHIFHPALLEE
ncbi:MAG: hypothetical protein ACFE9S_07605 [Candidatus Hermodarchaeota archaeon]